MAPARIELRLRPLTSKKGGTPIVPDVHDLIANRRQDRERKHAGNHEAKKAKKMTDPKEEARENPTAKRPMSVRELAELGGRKLVYIRAVLAGEVLEELAAEDADAQLDISPDATLYSVHAADGSRIALVGDRNIAFAAARQYEMNPVSVH